MKGSDWVLALIGLWFFYLMTTVPVTTPPPGVQGLVKYVKNLYNPAAGLVAVSPNKTGKTGVPFNYMDNSGTVNLPGWYTFLPFENWKYAVGLWGLDPTDTIAASIFSSLENLKTSVGWRPPSNDESTIGFIVPYHLQNKNICYTPNQKSAPLLKDSQGNPIEISSAAPYVLKTQTWTDLSTLQTPAYMLAAENPRGGDEQAAQCMNWFLRNQPAKANHVLDLFAATAVRESDGSIGFQNNGKRQKYRGIYLGYILGCIYSTGYTPPFPNGIMVSDVEKTAWGLQLGDGGLPNNYLNLSDKSGSIDEATNALLCAYSPGTIAWNQAVQKSGVFNENSVPTQNPVVKPTISI